MLRHELRSRAIVRALRRYGISWRECSMSVQSLWDFVDASTAIYRVIDEEVWGIVNSSSAAKFLEKVVGSLHKNECSISHQARHLADSSRPFGSSQMYRDQA